MKRNNLFTAALALPLTALTLLAALGLTACGRPDAPLAEHAHAALAVEASRAPAARTAPAAQAAPAAQPARDFRAEATQYIGYYKSIRLTASQEAVKTEALTKIPAPCCSENSIATCCCPCNLAKAVWGLSAHLIADQGYDAPRLEKAVRQWLAEANPNGYAGDACYKGGCSRSFDRDGCGGMVDGHVF